MVKKKRTQEDTSKSDDEQKRVEMMVCCSEGEGKVVSPQLKDEILMRLGSGLGDRGNVVMTRLDDTDLKQIDALVEVEAFKSRSEAAAFFIRQGMQARRDLFEKVMPTVEKIRELKEQAIRELGKKEQQQSGGEQLD
jgi:Arc/MetJ-type ribon-helix-helix transcriptional regulator